MQSSSSSSQKKIDDIDGVAAHPGLGNGRAMSFDIHSLDGVGEWLSSNPLEADACPSGPDWLTVSTNGGLY